jgi:RNA polymerase primary sigma factor
VRDLRPALSAGHGSWTTRAGRRPRLEPDVELELVTAAETGDRDARAALVDAYQPAIAAMARRYRGSGIDHEDLMQEGVVGLLRAAARYDPGFGTPFWAYASWWVRQAMQQLVSAVTGPLALSDRALNLLLCVRSAWQEHLQAHGREPSTDELAATTGLDVDQIEGLLAAAHRSRALDEPLGEEDGAPVTLGERLVDPQAERAYERADDRMASDALGDLSQRLNDRERAVVRAHYGLGRPARTLREIADELGLSAERVRQIEAKALDKLRAAVCVPAEPGG